MDSPRDQHIVIHWYRLDAAGKDYKPVRTRKVPTSYMPYGAYLSNHGALALVNPGFNRQAIDVVVLYRPDGSLLRKHAFGDLFSEEYAQCFIDTVSGPEWMNPQRSPELSNDLGQLKQSIQPRPNE